MRARALRAAGAAVAVAVAGPARAHSFESGADLYGQFLEGAGVVLGYPPVLLALAALAILLGLRDHEGLPRALPWFAGGLAAGIGVAALSGPWAVYVPMVLGTLAGILAALGFGWTAPVAAGLAALLGAGTMAASLEGHGLFELPVLIHVGIVFAAFLALAATAGLVRVTLERTEATWLRLAWRVAASWLAAILILYAAFSATGRA